MKKSLIAIVFAAATLPLTFAQTPAPASQPAPDQKSTATTKKGTKATKAPKAPKHSTKTSKTSTTAPSTPQK